ncbi:MAG TPA: ABC transporter ATP-binding protein [Steroidobacteraceae bacterium]
MSIALDQVTKRYQSLPVVNDVSLKVAQGEFLVLLGPSGSGKSTLLRAIAGLTEIDHGRVFLHGQDVTHVNVRERQVGFVFQHYALFRHMTIGENIEFALRVRKVKSAERRARRKELLRLVALEGMDDRLPSQLSGGQQQRIAVARALAHRPQVLLMDEPFGALDAKIREELRRTIRQIQRELGMTTILVTHDQEEAFALADRIGVMHQGRLLECGRPDDLYTRPQTRFVSTFLGAANLLLGYRTPNGVRFSAQVAQGQAVPREVVAVLRPEEVELGAGEGQMRSNFVGYGEIEEVLFSGAVERLRVRMAGDGPVPVAPGRDGQSETGSLLEVSRTLPEQREFPVAAGRRVAVGARRVHVLPTPISSFTAVADNDAAAKSLTDSPLLAALGTRMHTRVATHIGRGERAPPGMPAVSTGPGSAQLAEWLLGHGAAQLLCVPPTAPLPSHVVIHTLDADARGATVPVAASLLRHVAAEAVYLGIHPVASIEHDRTTYMRDLLDTRSTALADHGLDMRTELRLGVVTDELQRELSAHSHSMLVLGTSDPGHIDWTWLGQLLEGQPERPVLIVNAQPDRATER